MKKSLRCCKFKSNKESKMHHVKNKKIKFLLIILMVISSCSKQIDNHSISSGYGVFIGLENSEVVKVSEGYETIIIDAQYVSKEDINLMKERGKTVYTYLNIGSLETFRSYYEDYKQLILKPYIDWEGEFWIDIENKDWQNFIIKELSMELLDKNIDGFWVDNVDVYSHYPNINIYKGLENILNHLMSFEKAVIINSGNEFIKTYLNENNNVDNILTGVNQETVFTQIDFKNETFGTQNETETIYYLDYLNNINDLNKDVYLLEYATDQNLIDKIKDFASKKGWGYYVSKSIRLD